MAVRTGTVDLGALRLTAGEARRLEPAVAIEPLALGGQWYDVAPQAPARLDVSRMTGDGYALRLRFSAAVHGPCTRCLEPAAPELEVDARDVSRPGEGEELDSPYVVDGVLDLGAWARDALVLTLPLQLLCRTGCAGLCPVCGADLNAAGPEHAHEPPRDARWAKLSELRFE